MDDLRSLILDQILSRVRNKMPQMPVNPMGGLDNAPIPPSAPVIPIAPWTMKMNSGETTLSLPANHGANFEGYLNYNFNPFSPKNMGITGGGLRYRYEF